MRGLNANSVEWPQQNGGLVRQSGDHFRDTLLLRVASDETIARFEHFSDIDGRAVQTLVDLVGLGPRYVRNGLIDEAQFVVCIEGIASRTAAERDRARNCSSKARDSSNRSRKASRNRSSWHAKNKKRLHGPCIVLGPRCNQKKM